MLVAERDGPEMLARIAVMKALNRQSRPIRLFDDHGALLGARFKKREQSSNCTKFISLNSGLNMPELIAKHCEVIHYGVAMSGNRLACSCEVTGTVLRAAARRGRNIRRRVARCADVS